MRKLQFLQIQSLPVTRLVLVFASWMSYLCWCWIPDKHPGRRILPTGQKLHVFSQTPPPLPSLLPKCMPQWGRGVAHVSTGLSVPGDMAPNVVQQRQPARRVQGRFRMHATRSRIPEALWEGNSHTAWGLSFPHLGFQGVSCMSFVTTRKVQESHLGWVWRPL